MKACTRCGVSRPLEEFPVRKSSKDGRGYWCTPCKREADKAHYQRNAESRRQYFRDRHSERRDDSDYVEKKRGWRNSWAERNRQKIAEKNKRYREANREKIAYYSAQRRARSRNAEGSFTWEEWLQLCQRYGNVCLACGKKKPLTVDHVIPLVLGGTNWISNIQPLCKECNSGKYVRIIDYRPAVHA
jgi:5-methylcytosine-specific restriction endonuclease McrA